MARRFLILGCLIAFSVFAASGCQKGGTETGNPKSYSNSTYSVAAAYDEGWTTSESGGSSRASGAAPSNTDTASPTAAPMEGISTSGVASTLFTDGLTQVTLYYITVDLQGESLASYLQSVFPDRSLTVFSNTHLSGFFYDNSEAGSTGGDRREYYFLHDQTLLYVVTDLFPINDGVEKFETFIESLRFE